MCSEGSEMADSERVWWISILMKYKSQTGGGTSKKRKKSSWVSGETEKLRESKGKPEPH